MTTAYNKFFINGEWVEPDRPTLEVINPATKSLSPPYPWAPPTM